MREIKKEDSTGAGLVVLYGIARDSSIRTTFCKDISEVNKILEDINNISESAGTYVISVFAVGNYWDKTN